VTIVDTCFLVDLMKGEPGAEERARAEKNLRITSISWPDHDSRFGQDKSETYITAD
jgi:hypothetical protein